MRAYVLSFTQEAHASSGNGGTVVGDKMCNINVEADDFEGLTAFAAGSHVRPTASAHSLA